MPNDGLFLLGSIIAVFVIVFGYSKFESWLYSRNQVEPPWKKPLDEGEVCDYQKLVKKDK